MRHSGIPTSDIEEIAFRSAPNLERLLSKFVLVTGGSGFIGRWIVESLIRAAQMLRIDSKIVSLNRTIAPWQVEFVERGLLRVVTQDITSQLHLDEEFGYVFHCATPASAYLNESNPAAMRHVIQNGAEQIINYFSTRQTRIINVSSGAVYGIQPPDLQCLDEKWLMNSRFVLPNSAYHLSKFKAESMFNDVLSESSFEVVHARLFAFLAPFLPLDQHFAAGNFLKDALANKPIRVFGDGRTVRTYMYGSDLVIWLVAAAVRGTSGTAYNIGSPIETTIGELAEKIAEVSGSTGGVIHKLSTTSGHPPHRYVPCTSFAQQQLGVQLEISLESAIQRTLAWHKSPFRP